MGDHLSSTCKLLAVSSARVLFGRNGPGFRFSGFDSLSIKSARLGPSSSTGTPTPEKQPVVPWRAGTKLLHKFASLEYHDMLLFWNQSRGRLHCVQCIDGC